MELLFTWTAFFSLVIHAGIVTLIALRVLSKRRPSGVAMAWLTVIVVFPILGGLMYALVGETWLSGRRSKRTAQAAEELREPLNEMRCRFGVSVEFDHPAADAIAQLGLRRGMSPPMGGNQIEIYGTASESFDALIRDIDSAKESCDLLYYIWHPMGRVNDVAEALVRAEERGVDCRVMVDAVGGKALTRSTALDMLINAGVEVRESLPVNLLRGSLHRVDIRNHRKLAVIDNKVAHTGSLNMADPRYYMKNEGYGAWVDLTVRVAGPAAALLSEVFEIDWTMEEGDHEPPDLDPARIERVGDQFVQVVPSGPGQEPATLFHMLNAAVHGAQERLVLTTPYYVPDEAFAGGLVAAALRGVNTTVVVPKKVNGPLVGLASRAYYDDLLDAGVNVCLYEKGLLHAKTVTVDDSVGVIGTVNIDRRSFWLNYELSLVVHGYESVRSLVDIQSKYIANSVPLQETKWMRRRWPRRLAENTAQLFAPIL